MKILLLGATGRTGSLILKQALEKGHTLNCIARNPKRLKNQDGLQIFDGDPKDEALMTEAIIGCDAAITVLSISRKSDFPWAKLRTPQTYLSDVSKILVSVAEKRNVKRVVVCSAWGVSETGKDVPKWFKWLINKSNIGIAYRDHERQEQIISESGLDWTIVRPVGLTNSLKGQVIRETYNNNPRPGLTISRLSLAKYLLNCLETNSMIGKKVVISKSRNIN